jgi:tetratricopeptide (TPR) repeat protein
MLGRILIALLVALLLVSADAKAGERVALVIGNGGYRNVPLLPNPPNDASDVAASLTRLGFSVTSLTDLTYEGMHAALRDLNRKAQSADFAVVFFAGHGIEVGGQNWLIPIDAVLRSDAEIGKEAVGLDEIMQSIEASHFGLIILDSCRENPFAAAMVQRQSRRTITRGLGRVQPRGNLLVAYAARDGTLANDGHGRNSPFTAALLHNLETPGLEIGWLFRRVRNTVMEQTQGKQQPFTYEGFTSRELVYLKPPTPGVVPPPPDLITECDRLAASPDDKDRPASVAGIDRRNIDGLAAVSACESAVKSHPETARFYFQLGRAAWALKSYKRAHDLFAKASDMGSGLAAYDLGVIYLNGLDSEKNEAKARSWLQRGAELGDVHAMATLGLVYSLEPDRADDALAYGLFVKAADEDAVAMNSLGYFYENGRQVAQDYVAARSWYERAAARGSTVALRNLGSLYERGAGVSKDLATAKALYEKAAAAGDEQSKTRLRALR